MSATTKFHTIPLFNLVSLSVSQVLYKGMMSTK